MRTSFGKNWEPGEGTNGEPEGTKGIQRFLGCSYRAAEREPKGNLREPRVYGRFLGCSDRAAEPL